MTLIDANAMINLVDKYQPRSAEFRMAFNKLHLPVITTWPPFTEAMYLLFSIGGINLERKLWDYVLQGLILFHNPDSKEIQAISELMNRYHDRPMDLADATLVAAANTLSDSHILTQDSDFFIYQFQNNRSFDILP